MEPENAIKPSPKYLRWFFFLSGIIATVAYRIIFLLDSFWIEAAWYTGTIGFILYFGHRSWIEFKRAKLATEHQLIQAIEKSDVPADKKTVLLYLVKTTVTSKARFNSAFIFIISIAALLVNLAIDLGYFLFFQ